MEGRAAFSDVVVILMGVRAGLKREGMRARSVSRIRQRENELETV